MEESMTRMLLAVLVQSITILLKVVVMVLVRSVEYAYDSVHGLVLEIATVWLVVYVLSKVHTGSALILILNNN